MEALPRTYKGPKGFVQVSPLGMVSSVVYTDLPEFVRNQPELYRPHRARDQCTRVYGVRGIWKVVPPDLLLLLQVNTTSHPFPLILLPSGAATL